MKPFLLPLLFITTIAQAQDTRDTVWYYSGFTRMADTYNYLGKYKNTNFDTVRLGAFLPIKRIGNTLYLPGLLGDTLIIISENHPAQKDTLMDGYTFNKTATGFYEWGMPQSDGSITDHFYINYEKKIVPEPSVPARFFDYQRVGLIINLVRKQKSYSN